MPDIIDRSALTPMMEQYFEVKDQYADSILMYRLGDFYEMFFEDAEIASRVLDITLTGRACGLPEKAPMCGIPFHAANSYISKLVLAGYSGNDLFLGSNGTFLCAWSFCI